ncbi:GGDEF domain-containing protein [Salinicoccus roseus]|uniref:GGDEF domain-containing protein n=1 Tax=Salinicoccus roseus TaxID=45670 RepID=UPI0023007489|nr:GGDEF domain-containing protein [Salinicoccus roseus]
MAFNMFILFCMLVTFIYIYFQIKWKVTGWLANPKRESLYGGVMAGTFAIILNYYAVHAHENVYFGLSMVVLILALMFNSQAAYLLGGGILLLWLAFSPLAMPTASVLALCAILAGVFLADLLVHRLGPYPRAVILVAVAASEYFVSIGITADDYQVALVAASYYMLLSTVSAIAGISVIHYMQRSHELYETLSEDSTVDGLTGLLNRRVFEAELDALGKDEPSVLILMDIDHFKRFNDTYGHPEGDRTLKVVSRKVKNIVGKDGITARNGGEEFAILLKGRSKEDALEMAERIRTTLENSRHITAGGEYVGVTVSIGIAAYPEQAASPKKLYSQADEHLYIAKKLGRNQVCCESSHELITPSVDNIK